MSIPDSRYCPLPGGFAAIVLRRYAPKVVRRFAYRTPRGRNWPLRSNGSASHVFSLRALSRPLSTARPRLCWADHAARNFYRGEGRFRGFGRMVVPLPHPLPGPCRGGGPTSPRYSPTRNTLARLGGSRGVPGGVVLPAPLSSPVSSGLVRFRWPRPPAPAGSPPGPPKIGPLLGWRLPRPASRGVMVGRKKRTPRKSLRSTADRRAEYRPANSTTSSFSVCPLFEEQIYPPTLICFRRI